MSNRVLTGGPGGAAAGPVIEALASRETSLGGGLGIRRALPHRLRRRVGAWCFLDHFGPLDLGPGSPGMRVGPHPHMGLQTVSWLYAGAVLHRDSLGFRQLIHPGELNLMTSGHGISHSEESPQPHPAALHGLQFWIALPDAARHMAPAFEHHAALPVIARSGMRLTLVIGEGVGERSPARVHSPLAGFDVQLSDTGRRPLPLNPAFEYALLVTAGELTAEDTRMQPGTLYYLGSGRDTLALDNAAPARAFLFGGAPLREAVLLWWNFVARSTAEMQAARAEWQAGGARFGEVRGYDGARLDAPELDTRLRAG